MSTTTDFCLTTIGVAPVPPASGTTLVLASGVATFPPAPFDAAIWPNGVLPNRSNIEVVRVTEVNLLTGQFRIIRAQNQTTAKSVLAGWQIATVIAELALASDGVGFANPMTAIGDMIYGRNAGVATRLPGNTTLRRKFLAQAGTLPVSALPPVWTDGPRFNVRDFGAVGNGTTDDTAAINAARDALVAAGGGALYFPGGSYRTDGITAITSCPVHFVGDGFSTATIINSHLTNPTIQVTGQFMSIAWLKFTCTQDRMNGNPLFNIDGNGTDALVYVSNCQIRANADCFKAYRCLANFSQVTIKCLRQGGYALWCKSAGLTAVNCLFFTGGTNQPPLWLQGTATSISIANCGIAGAGPRASYVPSSITSTAGNFTVNFSVNHTFAVGDWINISGVTPSAYRGFWRIASKTATSVTITSPINPGNATISIAATALVADQRYVIGALGTTNWTTVGAAVNAVGIPFKANGAGTGSGTANGTVYSVSCSALIDNELGPINESQITGSQFGASGYPKDPLSVGLYVDGRRGDGAIEGWQLTASYVDIGRVGVLLTGKGPAGAGTTGRWLIDSCFFEGNAGDGDSTMLGQVWVEQCPGVTLRGLKGSDAAKDSDCKALYVYSDGAAPLCDGLKVTDSELGTCENWTSVGATNLAKYGAAFEGRINYLTFANNTVWGKTSPVLNTGPAIDATTVVKSSNNTFFTGTVFPTTPIYVPFFSNDGGVPVGGIVPYSGAFADIPSNWALCDGSGGTVDLRDRFILGTATEADVGTTGGTAQHKHAAGTLAADSASAGTPAGTVTVNTTTANDTATTGAGARVTAVTGASFAGTAMAGHTHTISGKTADAEDGGGSTADVLPPWFKLAFIQRMS